MNTDINCFSIVDGYRVKWFVDIEVFASGVRFSPIVRSVVSESGQILDDIETIIQDTSAYEPYFTFQIKEVRQGKDKVKVVFG